MKIKLMLIAVSFLLAPIMSAQNQIPLTDLEKAKEYLALTENQFMIAKQKVDKITSILVVDKKNNFRVKEEN